MYSVGAMDKSLLTSYHMGLYILIVTGLVIALITILKYIRNSNSDEHFSYLLKEDSRPQTTRMHRISSDLCRFWRTRIKDKDIDYTVFCHKNVPSNLLVEALPVYEIVNSLIGRAFYNTEAGRIHVHITYDAKTQLSGVLSIIVVNTGKGDVSPIYVGQEEQYEIFDLKTLEENVKRTNGYYAYKTNAGRGTEFSVSIPSDIFAPNQQDKENIKTPQIDPLAPKPTLQDMGQSDTATMKAILGTEQAEDNDLVASKTILKAEEASPVYEQDILDLTDVIHAPPNVHDLSDLTEKTASA